MTQRKMIKRSLSWSREIDRLEEVKGVLEEVPSNALSDSDLTLLADYLLKQTEMESEYGVDFWTFEDLPKNERSKRAEVLDLSLMEPYFSDAPTRATQSHKLHRKDVLKRLEGEPEKTALLWFNLWSRIDAIEYQVQWRDVREGRKGSPIRQQLFDRLRYKERINSADAPLLTNTELDSYLLELQGKASSMNEKEFKAAKMELVRLRKEQYIMLDSLKGTQVILSQRKKPAAWFDKQLNIEILPINRDGVAVSGWTPETIRAFQEGARTLLADNLYEPDATIDLTNIETMRSLVLDYDHIATLAEESMVARTIINYIDLYAKECAFEPHLLLLYEGRKEGTPGPELQCKIAEETGKEYRVNYLYTMFTKQVLTPMVIKARQHKMIVEAIAEGPEAFKQCSRCKEWKPRTDVFFGVRSSSKDGFVGYCRECRNK